MTKHDFSGRVAIVVGGTSGIGLATALAFARAGAAVTVAGRRQDLGLAAAQALEAAGARALFVRADVREDGDVAHVVAETMKRFGRLDCAVNSAGIGGDMAPLDRASQPVWDDVMAINARGVWLGMRHEIPAMLQSGGGAIVNVASIYGLAGKAAHHAYVASKHAVVGLTRSVALEYAGRGVRVNAICAGLTRTEAVSQAEAAFPDLVARMIAEHPMGRMASEDEIAASILWLCSDEAGFVTGAPFPVDGGFLAA
jgi:NAD(P)-dependent dehydrogenase (short-subunit alcohol dehydrogenase family)